MKNAIVFGLITLLLLLAGCGRSGETVLSSAESVASEAEEASEVFETIDKSEVETLLRYVDTLWVENGGHYRNELITVEKLSNSFVFRKVHEALMNSNNMDKNKAALEKLTQDEKKQIIKEALSKDSSETQEEYNNRLEYGLGYLCAIFTEQEVEDKFHEIFGSAAEITHHGVDYVFGNLYYVGGRYIDISREFCGDGQPTVMQRFESAKKSQSRIIIYNRYFCGMEENYSESDYINIYGSADEKIVLAEGLEKCKEVYEDPSKWQLYKHIFERAENGSYYWVSTEPAENY